MTEEPAHTPTLDQLTTELRDALEDGNNEWFELREAKMRNLYPDYAERVIQDVHSRHERDRAIFAVRSDLFAALDDIGTGVRDARTALGRAQEVYDVELVEGPPERLIPAALEQIETQLAAIHHLARGAQVDGWRRR